MLALRERIAQERALDLAQFLLLLRALVAGELVHDVEQRAECEIVIVGKASASLVPESRCAHLRPEGHPSGSESGGSKAGTGGESVGPTPFKSLLYVGRATPKGRRGRRRRRWS